MGDLRQGTPTIASGRQELLNQYAALEHLRRVHADGEAFILAFAEVSTAHHACEQSRIRLDKQLAWR